MNKRVLALLLCFCLIFGNLTAFAQEPEKDIPADSASDSVDDPQQKENVPAGPENAEEHSEADFSVNTSDADTPPADSGDQGSSNASSEKLIDTSSGEGGNVSSDEDETESAEGNQAEPAVNYTAESHSGESSGIPACSCAAERPLLKNHAENCARRVFCDELCAAAPEELFASWAEYPPDVQAYILSKLSGAKLEKLKKLIAGLHSELNTAVKETLTEAFRIITAGVPEDAELSVKSVLPDVTELLEKLEIRPDRAVFALDIKLLQGEGSWQPADGKTVDVKIENLGLPDGTAVRIVHIPDTADLLSSSVKTVEAVVQGGAVSFETDGFSTFIGYTVDFHYGDFDCSIAGEGSILLSELFVKLGIEKDAKTAVNVEFSDPALISLERQSDGDWLITSLAPFQTEETLTVSFADGNLTIAVTDDVTWQLFTDLRSRGVYSHLANPATGISRITFNLTLPDGTKSTSKVGNAVGGSEYFTLEGSYWYELSGSKVRYTSPGLAHPGTSTVILNAGAGRTYNMVGHDCGLINDKYSNIRQTSELVKSGEVENRQVWVYLDGETDNFIVSRSGVKVFPNRTDHDGGALLADDITVGAKPGYKYIKTALDQSNNIYKVYLKTECTVTASVDSGHGTASPSSKTVYKNNNVTVNFNAADGYLLDYIIDNGVRKDISNTKSYNYTIVSIQNNHTVVAYVIDEKYTVSYNPNGGSGAPDSQTKYYGTDLILSSLTPSREGFSFTGWNTQANGKGTQYSAGGTYTANSSVTLYAQWRADEYTVSYDANGGTSPPAAQTKYHGTDLTLRTELPEKQGYAFAGWNSSADGSGSAYSAGGSYTENASIVLYAQWTARNDIEYSLVHHYGSEPPVTEKRNDGTANAVLSVAELKKEQGNYVFDYATLKNSDEHIENVIIAPDGSLEIHLYYRLSILEKSYTVQHIFNGEVKKTDTCTVSVPADAQIPVEDITLLEKYTYDSNDKNLELSADGKKLSGAGNIAAGGVIKVLYRQENPLKVHMIVKGEFADMSHPFTGNISKTCLAAEPADSAYSLLDGESFTETLENALSIKLSDIELNEKYSLNLSFRIGTAEPQVLTLTDSTTADIDLSTVPGESVDIFIEYTCLTVEETGVSLGSSAPIAAALALIGMLSAAFVIIGIRRRKE